jgi:hypothetical protein
MEGRIKESTEPFNAGLLIVGLAHLRPTLLKLVTAGFKVLGYSWIEQRPRRKLYKPTGRHTRLAIASGLPAANSNCA